MDYLPLGCFGKAPCDLEYLEHNISFNSSRRLKQWIREGFKLARLAEDGNGRNDYREAGPRGFLIGKPDADEWLVGAIGPSTDQYPRENVLCVFTHVPRRRYGKYYPLLPVSLAPAWTALEDARRHLLELLTVDAFRDYLQSSRVPAPAETAQSKSEFKQGQLADVDRLFARADGARLDRIESNLPELLARLKDRRGASTTVEFPVSPGIADACFDAAFWIDLVNQHFMWRKPWPSVFLDLTPGTCDRSVVLVFGELATEAYGPIMVDDRSHSTVLRPAAAGPVEAGTVEAGQPEAAAAGVTFKDLLGRKFG